MTPTVLIRLHSQSESKRISGRDRSTLLTTVSEVEPLIPKPTQ